MTLDADLILDRRRLKRRLFWWRTLAVVALVGLGLAVYGRFDDVAARDHVSRLHLSGLILNDTDRLETIRSVAENRSAKALLVVIDSPGGSFVGSENVYGALREVAAEKPVVAVLQDLAASGGYLAALGADRIIAHPGTLTGSIGVILQTADVTELLENLGIEPVSIKSAPLKAQPNPLEPFTDDARQATKAVVDDVFQQFVALVLERRPLDAAGLKPYDDGRVVSGRQALAVGLIDALGGEKEAREWLDQDRGVPLSLPVRNIDADEDAGEWTEMLPAFVKKSADF